MKAKLIKQFKNHPAGMELNVTPRIYNGLLQGGFIAKPVPLVFAPDLIKAAKDLGTKKVEKKKPENKKEERSSH